MSDKLRGASVQISLDLAIACLVECLRMLPLQDVAFDDVLKQ